MMNWFRRLFGRGGQPGAAPRIGGFDELPLGAGEEGMPGEGGPHPYRTELAQLRWATQAEAVNVGRSDIDPELWPDGQVAFDFERALAHNHEGLRDRLSNLTAAALRDQARDLHLRGGEIAHHRRALADTDVKLAHTQREWQQQYTYMRDDPTEVGRYYRMLSKRVRRSRLAIGAAFALSEFILTTQVFAFAERDFFGTGAMLLSLGTTLLLIVVPHYAAKGLKEGLTRHHSFEHRAYSDRSILPPYQLNRSEHMEEEDDKGFRFAASIIGLMLVVLIVPISLLRTDHITADSELPETVTFLFLLMVQYAISGYFFLREWFDHGPMASHLYEIKEEGERLEHERQNHLKDISAATIEFNSAAEGLVFILREAPRWDSYLVETYLSTIRYFRHLVAIEQPELRPFIFHARVPYLGGSAEQDLSPYPLDAVSAENISLDDESPLGRRWWFSAAAEALRDGFHLEPGDDSTRPALSEQAAEAKLTDPTWIASKSPARILAEYLRMLGIREIYYTPPEELELQAWEVRTDVNGLPDIAAWDESAVADFSAQPSNPQLIKQEQDQNYRWPFSNGRTDGAAHGRNGVHASNGSSHANGSAAENGSSDRNQAATPTEDAKSSDEVIVMADLEAQSQDDGTIMAESTEKGDAER